MSDVPYSDSPLKSHQDVRRERENMEHRRPAITPPGSGNSKYPNAFSAV